MSDFYMPGKTEDGTWDYLKVTGRHLDKERFEEFKTIYYELEGWDPATGYPTRETLSALEMNWVADELEEHGKLGQDGDRRSFVFHLTR